MNIPALIFGFACLIPGLSTAAERLNVLFLAIDDLRPELGSFEAAHMVPPHIDALMKRGVRFDRAYCMVPTCGASRAALLSGIRPTPDRFLSYRTRVSEEALDITTLNTHFKNYGYRTISLGKIFHHADDNAEGWSQMPWRPQASTYATAGAKAARTKDRKGRLRGPSWENGGDVADDVYADGKVASRAVAELRDLARRDEPFFLAVGFFKPHLPFVAPGRYYERYAPETISLPENDYPTLCDLAGLPKPAHLVGTSLPSSRSATGSFARPTP